MANSEKRKNRIRLVAAARLSRLGLAGHPALYMSPDLEGYADYVFGCRSGPVCDVHNLFHELAHAAEFGPDAFRTRNRQGGFVFRIPKVFVLNRLCIEPLTHAATQREIRTFAHQLALMRSAGIKMREDAFFRQASRYMRYMPDVHNVPGKTEEEKLSHCERKAAEFYRTLQAGESLERLRGWLDLSAKRLQRLNKAVGTSRRLGIFHGQVWKLDAQARWVTA